MTSTLEALIAQKETLERQIKDAQSKAKADAVTKVRELMAQHGLTVADLVSAPSKRAGLQTGTKVAPKYRDPATGATWTGRGLRPKWLSSALESGKTLSDFVI